MPNKSTTQKIIAFVIFAIFSVGLLPFFLLAFYNHPSADDYLWTVMVLKSSLWQFQVYNFYEWSGRYFSNILVGLNPLVFHSLLGYQLAALFFIAIFFYSIFLVIKELTIGVFSLFEQLMGTLVFVVLFLAYTPSVTELFYWFTGAAVYSSANTLFFFFLYAFVRLMKASAEGKKSNALKISMVISVILMAWSNEVIIICLGGTLFLMACTATYYKHSTYRFLIILLLLTALSAVVSILAPGNAVRAAVMFPNKFNIEFTILATLKQFIGTLYWIKNVPLWLISFLFIPVGIKLSQKSPLFRHHFYIHPLLSIGLWLAILCFSYFPIYLATGLESVAMRVRASIYLFFLIGWFLNIQIMIGFLIKKYNLLERLPTLKKPLPIYVTLIILLLFSYKFFSTNSNVGEAWKDLQSGRAKSYDNKMKERYELFKQKKTIIPYISQRPVTLFFAELEENSTDWKNRNCAAYFDIDSIKVVK